MGLAKYREDDMPITDERMDGVFSRAPRLRSNAKEVKPGCC